VKGFKKAFCYSKSRSSPPRAVLTSARVGPYYVGTRIYIPPAYVPGTPYGGKASKFSPFGSTLRLDLGSTHVTQPSTQHPTPGPGTRAQAIGSGTRAQDLGTRWHHGSITWFGTWCMLAPVALAPWHLWLWHPYTMGFWSGYLDPYGIVSPIWVRVSGSRVTGQAPRHPSHRVRSWARHPGTQASRLRHQGHRPDHGLGQATGQATGQAQALGQASRLRYPNYRPGFRVRPGSRVRPGIQTPGSQGQVTGQGSNHGLGQAQAPGSGTQAPGYRPGTQAPGSWVRHPGTSQAQALTQAPRHPDHRLSQGQAPGPQGQVMGPALGQAPRHPDHRVRLWVKHPGHRPSTQAPEPQGKVIGSGTQAPGSQARLRLWVRSQAKHLGTRVRYPGTGQAPGPQGQVRHPGIQASRHRPGIRATG
jgi:hypothetical protein